MLKLHRVTVLGLTVGLAGALGGCQSDMSANTYSQGEAMQAAETYRGRIVSMRPIQIDRSSDSGVGTAVGVGSGALLGSQVGGGSGRVLGGLAGAALGGFAGHWIEDQHGRQHGFEYVVELNDGRMLTVAQGAEPSLQVNQRVLVSIPRNNRGRTRITPDTTYTAPQDRDAASDNDGHAHRNAQTTRHEGAAQS